MNQNDSEKNTVLRVSRLRLPALSRVLAYGASPLVVLAAAFAQREVLPPPSVAPFLFFYLAVTIAAWLGGLGPGLGAVVLSAALGNTFFTEPIGAFTLSRQIGPATLLFVPIAGAVAAISGSLRTALAQTATALAAEERMNQELRESEGRFRVMADGSPVILWVTDAAGGIEFVNRTYCEFFGAALEQVAGGKWQALVHPEDAPAYVEAFLRSVRERKPFRAEARVRRADGEWRWVVSFGDPRMTPGAKFLGHVGITVDVSEGKRAEEEKGKLQAQLLHAQKMESVGRLAGGVAHDFNNMLSVILGNVELALEQVGDDRARNNLIEVRKAAQRSAELTRQLLAFARKQLMSPKVLDLSETVAALCAILRRLIGEDIHLEWRPTPELWSIKADSAQIDQVLANLCVNARDAIVNVGKIGIEVGNCVFDEAYCAKHAWYFPGEYVLLAVRDDGCGMNQETQAHLFEPFFTTKAFGKGTGLGLATVYGIVQQNRGFVTVVSEPDAGTTFNIYWPRYVDESKLAAVVDGTAKPDLSGDETILFVEDELALLDLGKSMLERLGYTVLTASTPEEAIRLAGEHGARIRLLVTDVVMPGMNGVDLAKRLLPAIPGLRWIFMSGYTANVIAHHGVLDEGVNFIPKPFSRQELAAKVRAVLDGKHDVACSGC